MAWMPAPGGECKPARPLLLCTFRGRAPVPSFPCTRGPQPMIGIIGNPQSGKSSLLNLLMAGSGARKGKRDHEAVVAVPDPRLDWLSAKYKPKKHTPTQLEFTDPGAEPKNAGADLTALLALSDLRNCEGLALVLDHFSAGVDVEGVMDFELATVVADLDLVSRRLEKLVADRTRGLKEAEAEMVIMTRLQEHLETEAPLRTMGLSLEDQGRLRGYQFLTLKPVMVVSNTQEESAGSAPPAELVAACERAGHELCALSAPLEAEIAALEEAERTEFMAELGIEEPALDRFIRSAFSSLGLISFFTAGEDECRAWTVRDGASAPEAAGRIHTDLQRGFIRAELIAFADLEKHGDEKAAKAAGVYRLEGKDYVVRDGDVMEIRFSV
ncbi:redox-regulated ATPase YchF [bacterium]|nr:MAG: redox-regulated ATPase YchF [bacterium]